jgi:hypothetical protein
MADRDVPKNVEWVKERAACTLAQMFERLRGEIENDIATRNATLVKEPYSFKFISTASINRFSVLMDHPNDPYVNQAVIFVCDGKEITISHNPDVEIRTQIGRSFKATVTFDDCGECKFKVNGAVKESWQLRKMALEDLFFGLSG